MVAKEELVLVVGASSGVLGVAKRLSNPAVLFMEKLKRHPLATGDLLCIFGVIMCKADVFFYRGVSLYEAFR